MEKPPQILELEKHLGFELEETLAKKLIEESLITKNPYLDLGKCGLDGTEPELELLAYCDHLETLIFSNSRSVNDYGENMEILNWRVLQSTNTNEDNNLVELPKLPKNIKILDISYSKISNISNLALCYELEHLYANINEIENIEPLCFLKKLKTIQLATNKINNIQYISSLNELQIVHFSRNSISDISYFNGLSSLKYLNLHNSRIKEIQMLNNLENLIKLDLSTNDISYVSLDFLLRFPKLKYLDLSRNPITNLPKEIFNKPLTNVYEFVTHYLEASKKGTSKNKEVKIILIGNGSVGKTQIANALKCYDEEVPFIFDVKHNSTHAINILQTDFEVITLNIWDFAGQDIYHATHRLFMQTRALFLLVWDSKNEAEPYHEWEGKTYKNETLQYWIEYAQHFGQGSPVLVVQNKVDDATEAQKTLPPQTLDFYKKKYPFIRSFLQVSARNEDKAKYPDSQSNFRVLTHWINKSFEEYPTLKEQLAIDLPTSWVSIRKKVRELAKTQKILLIDDFQTLCEKEDIGEQVNTLLTYFHDTGVFYYRENYFENQIILDQSWAINAIYQVLNKNEGSYFELLEVEKGVLKYNNLCKIWQQNTDKERALFMDFMLSTELAFEITENRKHDTPLQERIFVVPQLLPETILDFDKEFWVETYGLHYTEIKEYRFLPSVYIQRFIVKANKEELSKIEDMWQHGILLQKNNTFAMVEADYTTVPKRIIIKSNTKESILSILEELEEIAGEGKVKPQDVEKPIDYIVMGEKRLRGLVNFGKRTTLNSISQLSGSQVKLLQEALESAFPSITELTKFVRFELNRNLNSISGGSNIADASYDLIVHFESEGHINELIEKAYQTKPDNPKIKEFIKFLNQDPNGK